MPQTERIKVVDIFAGPGGLGEGFTSFVAGKCSPFQIVLSAEKDPTAHKTLTLRAFYRRYKSAADVPEEYYQILRGEITPDDLEGQHAAEWAEAQKEALRRFQEAMGEVPAADSTASETAKPEHEKHEKHEKHERKGFFGGKKKK